ncbi:MAG: response regulator transcription factor [Gemmatimonas sp.]
MQKVLIVDDQPEIRLLLKVTLRDEFEVIEASNGAGALAMLDAYDVRLMLLDVMMPGSIDGLNVLDIVRGDRQHRHVHVAMLTARGQKVDFEAAIARGADAYFTKPFSPAEVQQWVRDRLSGRPSFRDLTRS